MGPAISLCRQSLRVSLAPLWGCLRDYGFVFFLQGTGISGPVYSGLIYISENPTLCHLLPLSSLWLDLIHSRCPERIVKGLFLPLIRVLRRRVSILQRTKEESRNLSWDSLVAYYTFFYLNKSELIAYYLLICPKIHGLVKT